MYGGRMFEAGGSQDRRSGRGGWQARGGEWPGSERRGRRRGQYGPERPERPGRPGGPEWGRGRARRGDARYILLDALRDGPKHGYELIKVLEDRSGGKYVPSPGTVYPTLQYLEDQGFVRSKEEADRRIYSLTEAGQAELDARAEQVNAFWKRFAGQGAVGAAQPEVGFLQDELEHLNRIVWSGLRPAMAEGRQDAIRRVRAAVEECQQKVRAIIAEG